MGLEQADQMGSDFPNQIGFGLDICIGLLLQFTHGHRGFLRWCYYHEEFERNAIIPIIFQHTSYHFDVEKATNIKWHKKRADSQNPLSPIISYSPYSFTSL